MTEEILARRLDHSNALLTQVSYNALDVDRLLGSARIAKVQLLQTPQNDVNRTEGACAPNACARKVQASGFGVWGWGLAFRVMVLRCVTVHDRGALVMGRQA